MKLETKIFLGAFLALVAAYFVIKVLPGSVDAVIASRRYEQQQKIHESLRALSPALLVKRCGLPSKDEPLISGGIYFWREMVYKQGSVTFHFDNGTEGMSKRPDENDPRQWVLSVRTFAGARDAAAAQSLPCSIGTIN